MNCDKDRNVIPSDSQRVDTHLSAVVLWGDLETERNGEVYEGTSQIQPMIISWLGEVAIGVRAH